MNALIDLFSDPNAWIALATLTVMEIVLGIDNIVFISVIIEKLPANQAARGRQIGLFLALIFRVLLLLVLSWLIGLSEPIMELFGETFSWRDIILVAGGLFLIYKGTSEIHEEFEGETEEQEAERKQGAGFAYVIVQIVIIDMVFSLDSIITAIGMVEQVEIMIAAVVIAIGIMYVASGPIADFIKRHPTTKMLALAFLILIGISLLADGTGFHIPRGHIYFAMAFATLVEIFNVLARKKRTAKTK